jgi:hypothetical protein
LFAVVTEYATFTPVITAPAGIVTDKGIGQLEFVDIVGLATYKELATPDE